MTLPWDADTPTVYGACECGHRGRDHRQMPVVRNDKIEIAVWECLKDNCPCTTYMESADGPNT